MNARCSTPKSEPTVKTYVMFCVLADIIVALIIGNTRYLCCTFFLEHRDIKMCHCNLITIEQIDNNARRLDAQKGGVQ